MDQSIARAVIRKLNLRIVYFASFLFFLAWLDRSNVSFAALRMSQDLQFSATVYGLGAGLFFISYALFEVPSNLVLYRVGARFWLARIMVTWGIISAAFAFIQGETSFYILRFLLGVAEAGFFPGVVYYFAQWFPSEQRAKAYAILVATPMVALILMGPISGWLLGATDGLLGVAGWRWMFLIEGIPSIIFGVVTFFYLTDSIDDANWLSPPEKTWLKEALEADKRSEPPIDFASVMAFLRDGRVWVLTGIYFFWTLGGYGIIFWLPQILKSVGSLSNLQVGFLFSIPFVCALISMLIVSRHSDRTGERKMHVVICALLGAIALAASAYVASPLIAFILICVSAIGSYGLQPIFWTLPTGYLGGKSAAAGIAFVNCAAGIGGFCGPYLVGWIKDATGSFSPALLALAIALVVIALLTLSIRIKRTPPLVGDPSSLVV
jgi:MFS transporter, ACS family, tartrate transporter